MKKKIALLAGGYTDEAKVSYQSAEFVHSQIDKNKYDVYLIAITPQKWFYREEDENVEYVIDKNDFSLSVRDSKITFDLVFIMIHGGPGEDGQLQGYFDMLGIKYTGCGLLSSALTMNKGYTKSVLNDIKNLNVAKSLVFHKGEKEKAEEQILKELNFPLFVKPNNGGSSIGMSKVNSQSEVKQALVKAFNTENVATEVIVEEFIRGREFTQGIYTNKYGEIIALPPSEVKTKREFFDFDAKYVPGFTEEITPADLSQKQLTSIVPILKDIYVRLNCRGMVRVDYFLEYETEKFFFVEINTIPGQTKQSFIPQQVRAAGMSEADFYMELIDSCFLSV